MQVAVVAGVIQMGLEVLAATEAAEQVLAVQEATGLLEHPTQVAVAAVPPELVLAVLAALES